MRRSCRAPCNRQSAYTGVQELMMSKVLCAIFGNLPSPASLPLSSLRCNFQNKTGTEPLTLSFPGPLYIKDPLQKELSSKNWNFDTALSVRGVPAASVNLTCRPRITFALSYIVVANQIRGPNNRVTEHLIDHLLLTHL